MNRLLAKVNILREIPHFICVYLRLSAVHYLQLVFLQEVYITHYLLPITHYPLPITHYPLPITYYPIPNPNNL
ncbi:MAG: hypothetical protein U7123_13280 [Potamolinea sp.]